MSRSPLFRSDFPSQEIWSWCRTPCPLSPPPFEWGDSSGYSRPLRDPICSSSMKSFAGSLLRTGFLWSPLHRVLESLGRSEGRRFCSGNLDLRPCSRINAGSRLPLPHPERAEEADPDLAVFLQNLPYGFNQGLESRLCFCLGDAGFLGDLSNEFGLGHKTTLLP